jgi:hypothetical protein
VNNRVQRSRKRIGPPDYLCTTDPAYVAVAAVIAVGVLCGDKIPAIRQDACWPWDEPASILCPWLGVGYGPAIEEEGVAIVGHYVPWQAHQSLDEKAVGRIEAVRARVESDQLTPIGNQAVL